MTQAAEADAASGTGGVAGNDTRNGGSEDDSHEEEQEETGMTWGHAKLPPDVHGSNPFNKTRGNRQHVVWNDVKCLKKHTAHGTTVDAKYTHVCTAKITAKKAGEEGDDEDDMRAEYDNLRSRIETSETRISKQLLEKAEEQAREASRMHDT